MARREIRATASRRREEEVEEPSLGERLLGLLPKVAMGVATSGISDALGSFFEPVADELLDEPLKAVTGEVTGKAAEGAVEAVRRPAEGLVSGRVLQGRFGLEGEEPLRLLEEWGIPERVPPGRGIKEAVASSVEPSGAAREAMSKIVEEDIQKTPILQRINAEMPQIGMGGMEMFSAAEAPDYSSSAAGAVERAPVAEEAASFTERIPGQVGRGALTAGGEELRKELAQRERLFRVSEPTASVRDGWEPGPGWDHPTRREVSPAPQVVERAPAPRRRRLARPVEVPGFDPVGGSRVASREETERLFGQQPAVPGFDPVGGSRMARQDEMASLFPYQAALSKPPIDARVGNPEELYQAALSKPPIDARVGNPEELYQAALSKPPIDARVPSIGPAPPPIIAETGGSGDAYGAPVIAERGGSGDAYRAMMQMEGAGPPTSMAPPVMNIQEGWDRGMPGAGPVPEPTYPEGGYMDLQQAILIKASQDEADRQRRLAEQITRGPIYSFRR